MVSGNRKRRSRRLKLLPFVIERCITFVCLAHLHNDHEKISGQPVLLLGVVTKTQHGGHATPSNICEHAKLAMIQAVLTRHHVLAT